MPKSVHDPCYKSCYDLMQDVAKMRTRARCIYQDAQMNRRRSRTVASPPGRMKYLVAAATYRANTVSEAAYWVFW